MTVQQPRLDYLLAIYNYNTALGRQYFDYRERLTATVFLAYAALVTAVVTLKFSPPCAAIAITLIVLAKYAESFQLKLYERSAYHFSRAHELISQIDSEFGEDYRSVGEILKTAKSKHQSGFKIKRNESVRNRVLKANTHDQWANLHRMFIVFGLLMLATICGVWISQNWQAVSAFLAPRQNP